MIYARHRVTGMVYTSYKKEFGGLASVTTMNTPYPYLVKDINVEKSQKPWPTGNTKLYPVPAPQNKGKRFNRWGTWVEVNFKNPRTIEQMIMEREAIIAEIPNAEARQVESDYIAALKENLKELS